MQEKHKPRPPHLDREGPEVDEGHEVEVTSGSPVRCPYCHDACTASEQRVVVCQDCLSRHHDACWREGASRCASCSGRRALRGSAPEVKVAPAELTLITRGLSREAVDRLRRRVPDLDEAAALRALLEAAARALSESGKTVLGLSQGTLVALVAIGGGLLIPILAILMDPR